MTLLFVVLVFAHWLTKQSGSGAPALATASAQPSAVTWDCPEKQEALALIRSAVMLQDPAWLRDHFHLGECESAEAMDFLRRLRADMGDDMQFRWVGDIGRGAQPLAAALISPNQPSSQLRLAILTPDDQGSWKLDFGALACVTSPSWETLMEGGAVAATARVVFRPDSYYNGHFLEQDWICHRLSSPNSTEVIYGYCRRQSAQHIALESILERSRPAQASEPLHPEQENRPEPGHRAILQLKGTPEAIGKQYEITRVMASDWVEESQPYDLRFKDRVAPVLMAY